MLENNVKRLSIAFACALALESGAIDGQVNPNGRIQSQGWLALGPFTNPFAFIDPRHGAGRGG